MVSLETVAVLLLSVVMFIASFSAGTLPLAMSLSHEKMSLISSLGIGLLVGTSLGVVLPEGIETLYMSMESVSPGGGHNLIRKAEHSIPNAVPHRATLNQESDHTEHSYHLAIGLSLVTGYLVMHILTFLPPLLIAKKSHAPIPLSSLPSSPRSERGSGAPTIDTPTGLSNTTIGLCIHALADGIALGSSAVSNNLALEGIVFVAIMLHKAPASFSLTAILLRESYPRHSVKRQLLLFALSSPLSTVLTYFVLSSIFMDESRISFWSGVFLLFSAGTLIFASTNVHLHSAEEEEEKITEGNNALGELFAGILGMCIPIILGGLGHGH